MVMVDAPGTIVWVPTTNTDASLAVTVAPPIVKTGTTVGGARTSVEVPRITAEADGASDTGTPDTVMAEPPAVID